jgi:hypothetical protein
MKKLLVFACITAFAIFFGSCKKINLVESKTDQIDVSRVKTKVDVWISQKKQLFNEVKKANIELLTENLQYSEAVYENYGSNKRILVIPVAEAFKQQKGVEKTKQLTLVLALNAADEIETGNLMLFIPKAGKNIDRLPRETFSKIINKTAPETDGKYKFLSIAGTLVFEMDYEGQNLKSFSKVQQHANAQNARSSCTDWYWVTTYYYPDGSTYQTWDYVATTCDGDGCYDPELASVCPGGDGGGSESISMTLEPNENIDGVDNICESSFKFQQAVASSNGAGGWRLAGTTDIRMKVVNLSTGEYVPLNLPTIYFGLPIFRANGEYYSESRAKEIAAEAVQYAEDEVMRVYRSVGGNLNVAAMTLFYREKIDEKMQSYAGSATLTPGSNMSVSELGKASYGWPILGCL